MVKLNLLDILKEDEIISQLSVLQPSFFMDVFYKVLDSSISDVNVHKKCYDNPLINNAVSYFNNNLKSDEDNVLLFKNYWNSLISLLGEYVKELTGCSDASVYRPWR